MHKFGWKEYTERGNSSIKCELSVKSFPYPRIRLGRPEEEEEEDKLTNSSHLGVGKGDL